MTPNRNLSRSILLFGAITAMVGCGSSAETPSSAGAGGAGAGDAGEGGAIGGESGAPSGGESGAIGGVSGAPSGGESGGSPGGEHAAGQAGSNAAGEGGEAGAFDPGVLDPPPTLDLATCEAYGAMPDECAQCCTTSDFSSSTNYDGKCICGTHAEDSSVCGSIAAEGCFSCCNAAGFASSSFAFDEPAGGCSCENKIDSEVCASALNAADPEPACQVCCLNHGFLSADYEPAQQCNCQSG